MSPISKNFLVALAALPLAMGIASASRTPDIVDPPVFASSNGLLDPLMIAQPSVVTGLTFEGFGPDGLVLHGLSAPPERQCLAERFGHGQFQGRVLARVAARRRIEDPARQQLARLGAVDGRAHPR